QTLRYCATFADARNPDFGKRIWGLVVRARVCDPHRAQPPQRPSQARVQLNPNAPQMTIGTKPLPIQDFSDCSDMVQRQDLLETGETVCLPASDVFLKGGKNQRC